MTIQLTSIQKGILIEGQLNGDVVNNIGGYQIYRCAIDKALYEQARAMLIAHHDALRLVFNAEKDGLELKEDACAPLGYQDFSVTDEPEKQALSWIQEQMSLPFVDTGHGLLEDALIKVKKDEYWYYAKAHHIIIDGWGFSVMMATFLKFYETLQKIPADKIKLPPFPSFMDYINKYPDYLNSNSYQKSKAYWMERFASLPDPLFVPKAETFESRSQRDSTTLAVNDFKEMRDFCSKNECSPVHFLLATLYAFFHRMTSAEDMVIALPSHNRTTPEDRSLVGVMVNVNPVRLEFTDSVPKTFLALVKGVAKYLRSDYRHNKFPISDLRGGLSSNLSASKSSGKNARLQSLFDLSFNYQKLDFELKLNGDPVETNFLTHDREQIPLIFTACEYDKDQEVVLHLDFNLNFFSVQEGQALLERYRRFLVQVIRQPDTAISAFSLLFEDEVQALEAINQTHLDLPECSRYTELFEQSVVKYPEQIAASCQDSRISYDALNRRANQFAHYLIQQGVTSKEIVGVHLPRSLDMHAVLIAIAKIGACYLPLDRSYPEERLLYMLEDSGTHFLVTEGEAVGFSQLGVHCFDLSLLQQEIQTITDENLSLPLNDPDALAYIIYTSGSTGKPKGVGVKHANLLNLLSSMMVDPGVSASDKLLAVTPISFDIHVFELYGPLLRGAQSVIATSDQAIDGDQLVNIIVNEKINLMQATPATWKLLLAADLPAVPGLRAVIGGEALSPELVRALNDRGIAVWNMYGPTETTVYSSGCLQDDLERGVTIGRPVANTQLYILDPYQQLVPPGVAGELYIGGAGVAKGYLNREALTAERFIDNPYGEGRVYRTGDLVRWQLNDLGKPDRVEYLGRIDHQVKIRGFRVELGEIESRLLQQAEIKDAVVVASKDSSGSDRLVAYLVCKAARTDQQSQDLINDMKVRLSTVLPDYMVPGLFMVLAEFPLTPSGKINRKALPEVTTESQTESVYVAPQTSEQAQLCRIWQQVLEIEQVGIEDDFFALGGHSLLAARVISLIRREMSVEVPLRALFEHSTVAALTKAIGHYDQSQILPPIVVRHDLHPPLSFAQQRLWFIDRLEGGSSQYNMVGAFTLDGVLDKAALQSAFRAIIQRHEVLRTRFVVEDEDVSLSLRLDTDFGFQEIDLSEQDEKYQQADLYQWIKAEADRPFKLTGETLLRVQIIRLAEQQHVLIVNLHHIVADGWSVGILLKEFSELYHQYHNNKDISLAPLDVSSLALPSLKIQYGDYAAWQREWLKGEVLTAELNYWKNRLAGVPQVHNLPLDKPRPAQQQYQGDTLMARVDGELYQQLQNTCKAQGVTLFMFLQAAFATLLHRYSGETDILMGSPVAGRIHQDIEPLIGMFVNTLVLRNDFEGMDSFNDLLAQSRQRIIEAQQHQHVPFEMLVDELKPQRSLSHSPLFQVLFTLQNNEQAAMELDDLTVTAKPLLRDSTKFDFELTVTEEEAGIRFEWTYSTALFHAHSIRQMADGLSGLLTTFANNPNQSLAGVSLLSEQQVEAQLDWGRRFAGTLSGQKEAGQKEAGQKESGQKAQGQNERRYSTDTCLPDLFEQQADKTPDAIALEVADKALTYSELNHRAEQLADHLKTLGCEPESRVGLCLNRSEHLFIGLLAILKAGAAYVPMDPAYPKERVSFMLEDAAVRCVLTEAALIEPLALARYQPIALDEGFRDIRSSETTANKRSLNANHLAYVIYTSGSTGQPKGVQIAHRNAVAMLEWAQQAFTAEQRRRVLCSTSMSFDLFVFEIWSAWSCGGTVVGVDNILALMAEDTTNRLDVSLINTVPSAATALLEQDYDFAGVEVVNLAGEPLKQRLVNRLFAVNANLQVNNLYGPSEDTTYSTHERYTGPITTEPSIGRGINDTWLYVLDEQKHLVPPGVVGELYIAGAGVSRGYLNRDDLTQARFIDNPFEANVNNTGAKTPGAKNPGKMYGTGDLVRWQRDEAGNPDRLEYLGRIDHQVKLRGFRIELGEIESRLLQQPEIKDVVVVVSDERLVAYVVWTDALGNDLIPELKSRLSAQLPDYMVPSVFAVLDALPLTPNGKIDRKALPEITHNSKGKRRYVAPQTIEQEKLCDIWQQTLNLDQVGIEDDFFALGGHSLLAARLISQIRRQLSVEVPLKALFEHPTVASMATALGDYQQNKVLPPIVARHEQHPPLSFAQQRLWFIDRFEGGSSQYNMLGAFTLEGELNRPALLSAFEAIVARHEVLRTRFVNSGDEVNLNVLEDNGLGYQEVDLTGLQAQAQNNAINELIETELSRPFSLTDESLLRVHVAQLSDSQHVLLVNMHHIVTDGWSIAILIREFSECYHQLHTGERHEITPFDVSPLDIQYGDYAAWQREWFQGEVLASELDYWKSRLVGIPQVHSLPLDKPRPVQQQFIGKTLTSQIDTELVLQLQNTCSEQGVTLFMFLQAAFATLLHRYSGETDILMGSPVAGRSHQDIEPLIGMFVNTLVLRNEFEGVQSFNGLLAQSRQRIIEAQQHQHVPFEMLVDELKPERSLSHTPVFQILFTLQNNERVSIELDNLTISELPVEDNNIKYDLELTIVEDQGRLTLDWTYSVGLFAEATIKRMADNFNELLKHLIASPETRLEKVACLQAAQEALLLQQWSGVDQPYTRKDNLLAAFSEQVKTRPAQIAAVFNDQNITYKTLEQQANQLAHYLQRQGIETGALIGLAVPRSIEMVVAILGIIKAGAAYIPLDTDLPEERLTYLLENSGTQIIVTTEQESTHLPIRDQQLVCLDGVDFMTSMENLPVNSPAQMEKEDVAQQIAYVIYTSGSTGKPKGVKVSHRAIATHIHAWGNALQIQPGERLLQMATINFDTSVEQVFVALSFGAQLCIIDPQQMTASAMWRYLQQQKVNIADFTPSFFNTLISTDDLSELVHNSDLRLVTMGGEALSKSIQQRWDQHQLWQKCRLINAYGPTEATVTATFYELTGKEAGNVPIGNPLPGVTTYVISSVGQSFYGESLHGQLCPPGVVGELYLGGDTLADGYLGLDEITAEKFNDKIFNGQLGRLYATGDLARFDAKGCLEFVGRIDEQVKVRGYRVELGEIEAAMTKLDFIQDAVVTLVSQGQGNEFLAAYLIQETGSELVPEEAMKNCQTHLKETLPQYMQPASINWVDSIPLTVNGKVDKDALPAPQFQSAEAKWQAPSTDIQQQMAQIWAQVLGQDANKISIHDDFFALGGQSLLLMKLIASVEQKYQLEVNVKDMFSYATLEAQAGYLEQRVEQQKLLQQLQHQVEEEQDLNELMI